VEEVYAHTAKYLFGMLKLLSLSTDHKGKRAGMRTCYSTRHGRIQEHKIVLDGLRIEFLGCDRGNSADIADVGSLFSAFKNTSSLSEDAFNMFGLWQRSDNPICILDRIFY
jgi:hypothetical protein